MINFLGKATKLPVSAADRLPSSWKGFNLLNMFSLGRPERNRAFAEEDFKIISEWGFSFVRLPMDYRIWIRSNDWNIIDESAIEQIDKAIEYGIKYDVHVCLNFHRAPGYTVAYPPEATDLWTQAEPQEAFARMWAYFAERYKNIPNEYLSFNFVNEPADVDEAVYAAVIEKTAAAIWTQDPDRLLIADGLAYGRNPCKSLLKLGIAQATRGYEPFTLTHYKANWVKDAENFPLPAWPVSEDSILKDKKWLKEAYLKPWDDLVNSGCGAMVGEWGAHNKTPHDVVLSWMEDSLKVFKEIGIGWALWNLYGSFGVLNSERADVDYEDYRGHKLDRKMLELLQKFLD